jgi:hypothetical protein
VRYVGGVFSLDGSGAYGVAWFSRRQVQPAFAHARAGGIALHVFRWDLTRFGLGTADPVCHVIGVDPAQLEAFSRRLGIEQVKLTSPRPYRPDIWHFDAFGRVLIALCELYPPPPEIDGATLRGSLDSPTNM